MFREDQPLDLFIFRRQEIMRVALRRVTKAWRVLLKSQGWDNQLWTTSNHIHFHHHNHLVNTNTTRLLYGTDDLYTTLE